jgi:tetratricopeptide (TPR) repeat protein
MASAVPTAETLPHADIRALLRAGRNDEAIGRLCRVIVTAPGDLAAKQLLFDAFFQKRDWAPALVLAEELAQRLPDEAQVAMFVVATLSNMKRFDDAIARALAYLQRHGEDTTVLDALKVANFYTGRTDAAIRYGQRALELRDAEACRNAAAGTAAIVVPATPPVGRNVISFSLWGTNPCYSYGAMINFVLSRSIYPDWSCRFYVDRAVPKRCIAFLKDNGADIRAIEDEYPAVGLFQRFLVMNDPTVGRFLVRDCDARLTAGEARLVQEWIASDLPFHAVRDHVLHNELMIGCTWAGRTDCGIDVVELMRRYFVFGPSSKYGLDQRMLGQMLWPLIRSHCLVHDKYYTLAGVRTVKLTDPASHYGGGHQNLDSVLAEVKRLGLPKLD